MPSLPVRLVGPGRLWTGLLLIALCGAVLAGGVASVDWLWAFPREFAEGGDICTGALGFLVGIVLALIMAVAVAAACVFAGIGLIAAIALIASALRGREGPRAPEPSGTGPMILRR